MSDPFAVEQQSEVEEVKKGRGRGRSVANITAKAADNLRTDTDQRIKFKRDQPRVNSTDVELNLSVPAGTVPPGYKAHWFPDNGNGEIDNALRGWWGHLTDAQGVNISRTKGKVVNYLMVIEEELYNETEVLRMKAYRDSIGENDRAELGVAGVESYTPKGVTNKIKIQNDSGLNDPFAS